MCLLQNQRQILRFPGVLQIFSTLPSHSKNATLMQPLLTVSRETPIPLNSEPG